MNYTDFFQKEGKINIIPENGHLLIDDPQKVYYVDQGTLLLFIVSLDKDKTPGSRKFIKEFSKGEFFYGEKIYSRGNEDISLLAVGGTSGAKIYIANKNGIDLEKTLLIV